MVDAYEKRDRLHRDISANNILLVRDSGTTKRMAYVIDWEFSVKSAEARSHCYRIPVCSVSTGVNSSCLDLFSGNMAVRFVSIVGKSRS